jgi:hypothetical protein
VLKNNESPTLILFLQGVYNPNIQFDVKNIPSYKKLEDIAGMGYSNIELEIKRAYLFQKHHPKRPRELSDERQEQLLIQILESLEPREADLFANMLLKKINVPTMSKLLADSAFPGKI